MPKANEEPREQDVIAQGRLRWSHSDPIPKAGFQCVAVNDLGRWNYTACEMCGTRIRYVHTMQHPEWHEQPDVGYVCAGHLERPSEADDAAPFVKVAKEREQPLKRLEARAARRRGDLRKDKSNLASGSADLHRLMVRAQTRLRNAQDDGAPTDDEAIHIDDLTRRIREAGIAFRAKKFDGARDSFETMGLWDDPLALIASIWSEACDLVRGAEQDDDPALANYEAFKREVGEAYDDLLARRAAEERMSRSDSWWGSLRDWRLRGTGRQFKFHHARAWTFRRDDGRFSSAYEIGDGGVQWAPPWLYQTTEPEAAALVERSVAIKLVAQGFILDAAAWREGKRSASPPGS